jgi:hypothetical protein
MSPQKYANTLKEIELNEIYLESSSTEFKRENLELQKNLEVGIRDRASFEQKKNRLKVLHRYYLTIKLHESEGDFVAKISANFYLIFTTKNKIENDFFEIFKEINLKLNSWPYFREFVQNMTQRMNIPPLTLPFFKRG